jgi:hypothetical protein
MKSLVGFTKVSKKFGKKRIRNLDNIDKEKESYLELSEKIIDKSDIILELLDSRFIKETRNKTIEKKIKEKNKRIIYVLNKIDLVTNKEKLYRQVSFLLPRVFVSCKNYKGINELRQKIKNISKKIITEKTNLNKITVGVIGYPNTGKSSLINILTGKNSLGVSPKAGFTKGIIKINLTKDIVLLDSPGIIPDEKYSNMNNDLMIEQAKIGARDYTNLKNPDLFVLKIMKEYPNLLEKYYNLDTKEINGDPEALITSLGRKKGFLRKGGFIDEDKTARLIIKDWQEGKIKP